MYRVKECIIVEGIYDKIKLSQIVDATIFVTHGFSIFNNKKDMQTIKTLAKKNGVVILTDSDAAGFKIRNYIKQALPKDCVKHAYIPEIKGKERRKNKPGKEGILGVEGISEEIIINSLKKSGCILDKSNDIKSRITITKTDFFNLGLSGGKDSAQRRDILCKTLELPGKISPNMLLNAVNLLMSKEDFYVLCSDILSKEI